MNMTRSGIVANLKGEIMAYGKGAEKIFGYKKVEVMGKSVAIFHPKRTRGILPTLFETAMKGKFEEKVTLVRKSGEEFPALLKVTPVKNSKGEITGLVGVTKDLTRK